MSTVTHKKTRAGSDLHPALIEAYRSYPAVNIDDAIQALHAFLSHRRLFEALGDATLAAATERAWVQDAIILAGEAAPSADQARRKVEALQPALDGRDWHTADEGLRAAWAMITIAVEHERCRWGFEAATRH